MDDYLDEGDCLEQLFKDEEAKKKAMKKAAQPLKAGKCKLMYCASCQIAIVHQYQPIGNGSGGKWCCLSCKRKKERKTKVKKTGK